MPETTTQLQALETEFSEEFNCGISKGFLIIESGSGKYAISVYERNGELHAIEYAGETRAAAIRTELAKTELCDPNEFTKFVDLIANNIRKHK